MSKTLIGVMGSGESATAEENELAFELGKCIADKGWVLLSGGRDSGVMEAVNQGAKSAGGLTVGVLPDQNLDNCSDAVDIPILTKMGSARNNINVCSSDVVIAIGATSAGTVSEVAMALKAKKPIILLQAPEWAVDFYLKISNQIKVAKSVDEAVKMTESLI